MNQNHPAYRPDIDGLRAVAIILVVIFHAFPHWVSGGFVGVDVFFVISGFLITGILIDSLQKGSFSFSRFYAHRVRRLFPALLLVMASCYVFGAFVLFADEYQQLGKHVVASAGFVSNLVFWQEAGYFDNAANTKPLLHLWSLGVEEQFYLVWPLLLWLCWPRRIGAVSLMLAIGGVSFAVNIVTVHGDPVQAFYSPVSRLWELMLGGLLAYKAMAPANEIDRIGQSPTLKNLQAALGAILVLVAALYVRSDSSFPGWWALLPTVGAGLIIAAGPHAWLNRTVLSAPAMIWIGLFSYPLYLWHWPLLSFLRIVTGGTPTPGWRVGAVLASLLLAWLTYQWVEKPVRRGPISRRKIATLSLLMVAMTCAGIYAYVSQEDRLKATATGNGGGPMYPTRYVDNDLAFAWDEKKIRTTECKARVGLDEADDTMFCLAPPPLLSPTVAVLGDSHANAVFDAIQAAAALLGETAIQLGIPICPPTLGVERDNAGCPEKMSRLLAYLVGNEEIRVVVLNGRFAATESGNNFGLPQGPRFYTLKKVDQPELLDRREIFKSGLLELVNALQGAGKRVILMLDVPELNFDPRDCLRSEGNDSCSIDRGLVDQRQKGYRDLFGTVASQYPSLVVFDPLGYFCDDIKCIAEADNFVLYRDSHHLGVNGSVYLVRQGFDADLARVMRKP
jgi:peptidoglycan/LPS O-acetylase OafA/YrhL